MVIQGENQKLSLHQALSLETLLADHLLLIDFLADHLLLIAYEDRRGGSGYRKNEITRKTPLDPSPSAPASDEKLFRTSGSYILGFHHRIQSFVVTHQNGASLAEQLKKGVVLPRGQTHGLSTLIRT
ncbi:hypothetical protein Rs2_22405 [Raphanus sativus]|nr:hypothetical protein Rs2_22405 [Raphanus sativus]